MPLEYASTTTLRRIREAEPCHSGWTKLLAGLGKVRADDDPLDLITVLDINGLDDALWVLSYAMPNDRLARHFQADCAEDVLHIFENAHPSDNRVRKQIEMLRNDGASDDARDDARDDAEAAARAATLAATLVAVCVARSVARVSTWHGARLSAYAAATGVAWTAARSKQENILREMLTQRAE